ncbi:MAG: Lrp/AsnC family transcriptional regulator [Gammaproteobacteria bacterium]|nr:Lrp/AsnC family transcriptional regulator [Pseudomonadota bacterium]MCH9662053.1 Lrp/AsnC family transcriptional regulator [Gammaproteobacteria bacterium]
MNMDRIDKKILRELQDNCRISFTELAERVGLTPSPCIERMRSLKADGHIRSYSAVLNPEKFDCALVVFVQVSMTIKSKASFAMFRRKIADMPEVQECYLVTGKSDFFVKIRVGDISAYKDFLEEKLLTIPGIEGSESIVVMDTIKEELFRPLS